MRRICHHNRRGAITVLAALFIAIMVLIVAFAVDVGVMKQRRTQHQLAADAASLAGADALYDADGRLQADQARAVAAEYFNLNGGQGTPTIALGRWNRDSREFVETEETPNAVRVYARQQYPTIFGRVANTDSFRASAGAVANTSAVPESETVITENVRIPIYGYTPACRRGVVGFRNEQRTRTVRVPGRDGRSGLVQ